MSETEHDDDSTAAATEPTEHHPVLPESWRQVFALIELAADPKGFKRRLHGLANAMAAASAAQVALAADRAAFDQHKTKELAEIAEERGTATKRLLDAQSAERKLAERFETITKLERAWSGLTLPGSPPEMPAGGLTRSRPFSGLQVARYAATHDGALPRHPDAEPDESTVNYDPQGTEFPAHTTITRTPEPPAGARVRGRHA